MIGPQTGAWRCCALLRELRVTLHVGRIGSIRANPAHAVTPELLELLKRYKPELRRAVLALADRQLTSEHLAPCLGCGAEFGALDHPTCPWCDAADVFGHRARAGQLPSQLSWHGNRVAGNDL